MTVSELIEALSGLNPDLSVLAEMVETGEVIPIDVVVKVGLAAYENVPDGDYVVLRPLEDWIVLHPGLDEDED